MKRRSSIVLLALAAASLTAGCTTLSDGNVAVRVDDTSYTLDDVSELADSIGLPENELQSIRLFVTDLVVVGTISSFLDDAGLSPTDADLEAGRAQAQQRAPGFGELSNELQQEFAAFFAVIEVANTLPDLANALNQAIADADIYVDPRIGTFDTDGGVVVPLG